VNEYNSNYDSYRIVVLFWLLEKFD
jgi:hypothetical protein